MSTPAVRLTPWPKYLSLVFMAAQRTVAYRRTVLINMATNLIWVVVAYYLWQAVFAAQPQIANFDWAHMRTYVLLAYAVNVLLNSSFGLYRIMFLIRDGNIANELIRPFNFLLAQLAQSLGNALVEGAFSCLVTLALGALVLRGQPHVSAAALGLFLVSVVLGFLIKFLINYLVALLCFWTKGIHGMMWAETAVTNILSGAVIPLEFYPGWLKQITLLLPFQGIIHTPLAIYQGDLSGSALWAALAVQVVWIGLLLLLTRWLWLPGLRALDIQGG